MSDNGVLSDVGRWCRCHLEPAEAGSPGHAERDTGSLGPGKEPGSVLQQDPNTLYPGKDPGAGAGSVKTCATCGTEATDAARVMRPGQPVRDETGRIWPTWQPGPWVYGCRWHRAETEPGGGGTMSKIERWGAGAWHFWLVLSGGLWLGLSGWAIDVSMWCTLRANRRFLRAGEFAKRVGLFEGIE